MSLGVPGVPLQPQILADQLTLSQPVRADYAHQIPNTCTPGFSDLPTDLRLHTTCQILFRRIEVQDVHWVLFLAEASPTNQVVPVTIG